MKDQYHNIKPVLAIAPAQLTGTTTSAAIDVLGFNSVTFAVLIGAVAAADAGNRFNITITEGPTNAAAGVVPTTDYIFETDDWDLAIDAVGEATSVKHFGWKRSTAGSRYLKVVLTETGAVDAFVGVVAILGDPDVKPTY